MKDTYNDILGLYCRGSDGQRLLDAQHVRVEGASERVTRSQQHWSAQHVDERPNDKVVRSIVQVGILLAARARSGTTSTTSSSTHESMRRKMNHQTSADCTSMTMNFTDENPHELTRHQLSQTAIVKSYLATE
jgi:hypothetical protein